MYIDTTSRASMEISVSNYLNITIDELYQFIDYAAEKAQQDGWAFNTEVFNSELETIFSNLQPQEKIDEILLFHLTRRLNNEGGDFRGCNLHSLLTQKTPISSFLKNYGIDFKDENDRITFYFHGRMVNLENTMNHNTCYLRGRLGYSNIHKDYCFNGFAMRDLLMKNSYARELYDGPELIVRLSSFLKNDNIQKDFFENSKYYCYRYKLPFDLILFDENDDMEDSKKTNYFLCQVCSRLLAYQYSRYEHMYDHENPILRLKDDYIIPTEYFENAEEITLDMLF